jgi:aconitate hydratase
LGLTGEELISIEGLARAMRDGGAAPREVRVRAHRANAAAAGTQISEREPVEEGPTIEFDARVRIDTPREADYFRHGGILQFVLRALLST